LGINGLPLSLRLILSVCVDPAYQEAAASKDGPFPLVVCPLACPDFRSSMFTLARAWLATFRGRHPVQYGDGVRGEPTKWELNSPEWQIGSTLTEPGTSSTDDPTVADSQQSSNLLSGLVGRIRLQSQAIVGGWPPWRWQAETTGL